MAEIKQNKSFGKLPKHFLTSCLFNFMVVEKLAELIILGMSSLGYAGLFFLMALESMIAPIPSEIVMPFAGFLVNSGRFTLLGVALVSGLGSVFGSLLSYWIGIFGGRKFILKYGKYLLLDESHLEWTERFFDKYGQKTIFISRFVPVVRHLISIPAGMGKMGLRKFLIYTFAGAVIWNTFLAWLGIKLGEKWSVIHDYSQQLDYIVIVLIIIAFAYFAYMHVKKRRNKSPEVL